MPETRSILVPPPCCRQRQRMRYVLERLHIRHTLASAFTFKPLRSPRVKCSVLNRIRAVAVGPEALKGREPVSGAMAEQAH